MAATKGWPNAAWTPATRRILLLSALILTLVAAAATLMAKAVDNRRRPPGIALMVNTDQHQIQRLMEEWRVQGREESNRWRKLRPPSFPPRSDSSSSSNSGDLKNKKRQLIGSWPPTCRAKCSGCAPCRAVHVSIQPGRSSPLEYYPEAWRCQCGNRLFMP